MDDLHWFQRFLHIFFFNLLVFGLFYVLFAQHTLIKIVSPEQPQALRTSAK